MPLWIENSRNNTEMTIFPTNFALALLTHVFKWIYVASIENNKICNRN